MKETKNLEIAISATEPTIIIVFQEHKKKIASPKPGQNRTYCIQFWYVQLQTNDDSLFSFMKQNISSLTYSLLKKSVGGTFK